MIRGPRSDEPIIGLGTTVETGSNSDRSIHIASELPYKATPLVQSGCKPGCRYVHIDVVLKNLLCGAALLPCRPGVRLQHRTTSESAQGIALSGRIAGEN